MTRSPGRGAAFLLEIGTEEIPARMVQGAIDDLAEALRGSLLEARLDPGQDGSLDLKTYATPRRLAILAQGLRERQPDRQEEVIGPPVKTAYDSGGRPTRAAEGFARAQGAKVEDLRRVPTPRGECVMLARTVRGRPAADVLAEIVPPLVSALSFPKTMRWGAGEHRFVRPIHSVLALLDERVVDLSIAGVRSGRETFGHRADGGNRLTIRRPADYLETLREHHVLADIAERRGAIETQLAQAARGAGGRIAPPPGGAPADGDPELLREVTHLVEWPTVIAGEFDAGFLDLPAEILVTSMRHHQKYFSLQDAGGRLLNRFLAVANSVGDRSGAVRRGNEWVLRARLADARFFWEEDRRVRLEEHGDSLDRVTFHEKLGSYARKTARLARLVAPLSEAFTAAGSAPNAGAAERAAVLCKNDLCTQMVKEFPELEGIVGGLYARADGLPEPVAAAIYSHYMPRGADDPLPRTPEGALVSLADRLDTQAGFFLLGIVPTGSRDPYGLRRSVQGACRILIENRVRLSLRGIVERALDGYTDPAPEGAVPREQARDALLEFYRGRLQHLGETASLRPDSVRAALAASADDPSDARLRMAALDALRAGHGLEALAQAHKRIKNILPARPAGTADPRALREEAEKVLYSSLEEARPGIEGAAGRGDYLGALQQIARLGPYLERYFKDVMVMDEDPVLRRNRLALLASIGDLLTRVGDFSEIVLEGEPAAAPARRPEG
jgi:glycyl-tRNA synthetase beta chain